MSEDERLTEEWRKLLIQKIEDGHTAIKDDIREIKDSLKETCAALNTHAELDETRYREFQDTDQTVKGAQKLIKVGAAAVGALGLKELWGLLKH